MSSASAAAGARRRRAGAIIEEPKNFKDNTNSTSIKEVSSQINTSPLQLLYLHESRIKFLEESLGEKIKHLENEISVLKKNSISSNTNTNINVSNKKYYDEMLLKVQNITLENTNHIVNINKNLDNISKDFDEKISNLSNSIALDKETDINNENLNNIKNLNIIKELFFTNSLPEENFDNTLKSGENILKIDDELMISSENLDDMLEIINTNNDNNENINTNNDNNENINTNDDNNENINTNDE